MTDSGAGLPIFSPDRIRASIGIADALEPVAAALVAYSQGRAVRPPLGLLQLANGGEAHIKSGYIHGHPYFVAKVATMVPANRARGLHGSDGAMLLCSAETGFPVALLHDRKYLTDIRTAAVGALAARLLAPAGIDTVGLFGTGGQARLQIEALALVRTFHHVLVWGRDRMQAEAAAEAIRSKVPGCTVEVEESAQSVVERSQLLVTATAATEPFIEGAWLRPGMHITAIGADDARKCELDSACLARATFIAADSRELAGKYGEIARHNHPLFDEDGVALPELGELLSGQRAFVRAPGDITISKHVGLGVEDLAIAALCFTRLTARDEESETRIEGEASVQSSVTRGA